MIRYLLLLITLICLEGCSHVEKWQKKMPSSSLNQESEPLELSVEKYISWVEDEENGLKVNKTIGNFTYSILYKPMAYEALLRLRGETITDSSYKSALKMMDSLQFITLRIKAGNGTKELLKTNLGSSDDYYSRIEYCSFQMQNDITLIEGDDTIPCSLFHFERIYDIAPEAVFVMSFPRSRFAIDGQHKTDMILSFEDRLFDNGKINLGIQRSTFQNIPIVKINN